MSQEDFKKLLEESRKSTDESLKQISEEQKRFREELNALSKFIEERVLPPLVYVETTVKSYADRYINEDHIRRLDKRLFTVEGNLRIQPPEELTIPTVD